MIIADTNVIAYLFINGEHSDKAKALLKYDSQWIAPILWKSEFRNVLTQYIRHGFLSLSEALLLLNEAGEFMRGNEFEVQSEEIMDLVVDSDFSAYDCEFIALAKKLNLRLYTLDKQILKSFPDVSFSLREF